MIRICFVCLGNICRSPTAEGVMVALLEERGLGDDVMIDSAGTSAFHVGEPAHAKSRAEAARRGVTLTSRSHQFVPADWRRFDYVLAMDRSNLRALQALPGADTFAGALRLFRDFDPEGRGADTPDPYYGGGFPAVFDICRRTCEGLLQHLQAEGRLPA